MVSIHIGKKQLITNIKNKGKALEKYIGQRI